MTTPSARCALTKDAPSPQCDGNQLSSRSKWLDLTLSRVGRRVLRRLLQVLRSTATHPAATPRPMTTNSWRVPGWWRTRRRA